MVNKNIKNLIDKSKISFLEIWSIFKTEGKETKIAFIIITKIIIGRKVSKAEVVFLKAHSKDLIRILPLIALQGIPLPIPFSLIFIMISKKYNIDILPKNNLNLLEEEKNKETWKKI
jgi:hypothetical protein